MVFLYRLEKASGRVHALALLCAARSALHLPAEEARYGLRELVLGCVLFVAAHGDGPAGETERKLAQAVSGFLGRQMEG